MNKKMYFEMLTFGLIFACGSFTCALIAKELHIWWLNREVRKSQKAIKQAEDEYYEELKQSLLVHIEALLREVEP